MQFSNNQEQPLKAQLSTQAPTFKADAYDTLEKTIKQISLDNYRGSWVILFFYPSDFTFV
ncbi:alkyl hydroperoxide reductase [Bacillus sp. FJAT-18017]|nr:alkyl hydroperoxide reductase [Bacillus sp. FJAT-18017]